MNVEQIEKEPFTIPATRLAEFHRQRDRKDPRRMGQQFYDYMQLEKVASEKRFCDRIYQSDGDEFNALIGSRIDYNN